MRTLTFWSADGFTQIQGVEALGNLIAGVTFVPVKLGIRNDGDEAYPTQVSLDGEAGSDGVSFARIGADTSGTLSPPWGVIGAANPGGGSWGGTGVKKIVVTAVNANGETTASLEGQATVTAGTQTVTWTWEAVPDAVSYNVYRGDGSGSYISPSLIASGLTDATFDDTGAAPSTGAPPEANTTGGAAPGYGTPPTVGVGPVTFGSAAAPGEMRFVWVGAVVPVGTTDDANTRLFAWAFA